MGDVWIERPRSPILGSQHWQRADDASGTQELCDFSCTMPDRTPIRYWIRRYEGQNLAIYYLARSPSRHLKKCHEAWRASRRTRTSSSEWSLIEAGYELGVRMY